MEIFENERVNDDGDNELDLIAPSPPAQNERNGVIDVSAQHG
nr:hypothetical protein [uncultured Celeribacter sp.]